MLFVWKSAQPMNWPPPQGGLSSGSVMRAQAWSWWGFKGFILFLHKHTSAGWEHGNFNLSHPVETHSLKLHCLI